MRFLLLSKSIRCSRQTLFASGVLLLQRKQTAVDQIKTEFIES